MDFWNSNFFRTWVIGWIIFGRFALFYICLGLVGFVGTLPLWLFGGREHGISAFPWYIQPIAVIYLIVISPFIFFVAAKISGVSFKRKQKQGPIFKSNLPGGTINGIPPDHDKT